jgi:hypothetical protein
MGRLKILAILIGLTSCRVFYEVVEYLPDNSGNDLLFWKGVLRVDMKETILDRHVQNRDNRPKNVCTWEPNTTECFTMLSEQLLLKNASEPIAPELLSTLMGLGGVIVFGIWQIIYTIPNFQILIIDSIASKNGSINVIIFTVIILTLVNFIHAICFFNLLIKFLD